MTLDEILAQTPGVKIYRLDPHALTNLEHPQVLRRVRHADDRPVDRQFQVGDVPARPVDVIVKPLGGRTEDPIPPLKSADHLPNRGVKE